MYRNQDEANVSSNIEVSLNTIIPSDKNRAFSLKLRTDNILQNDFNNFVEFIDSIIDEASKAGAYKVIFNCDKIENTCAYILNASKYKDYKFTRKVKYYNQFFNHYKNQGFKITLKNWFMSYFFNSICEIEISWENLK